MDRYIAIGAGIGFGGIFLYNYLYGSLGTTTPRKVELYLYNDNYQPYVQPVINGLEEDLYDNGQMRVRRTWKDGKLNRMSCSWYRDGTPRSVKMYRDGLLEGISFEYYRNGTLSSERNYSAGRLNGNYKIYYRDGLLRYDMIYENDKLVKVISALNRGGKNIILPETGEVTVYKVCKNDADEHVYVELLVPAEARRIPYIENYDEDGVGKTRVEYARVISIVDSNEKSYNTASAYIYGTKLTYTVGETVYPDSYNSDPEILCGHGINVHLNREDCEQWFN